MDSWHIVYTTMYPQEIYAARNFLESEGITTFLKDELTAQVHNFYSTAIGGVKLMVHTDDLERSRELLIEGGYITPRELEMPAPMRSFDSTDRDHCPYCGSADISRKKEVAAGAVFLTYFFGLVLPMFNKTFHCWECERDWRFGHKK